MQRRISLALIATLLLAGPAAAQAPAKPQPGEAAFRELFKEMVQTDTSYPNGDCTKLVQQVAVRMKAAGFPESGLHLFVPPQQPKAGILVAVYPGKDPKAKAVLMVGHIDVVAAKREDWTRDPFTLFEEGGTFYARGVVDMKGQAAIWADNLIRYQQEGYKPRRTVKMALTCGEDSPFLNGAKWLTENQRELIDAGIALNEGGVGQMDDKGKHIGNTVEAAQKWSMGFILEATNPGGHSSRPRPDNAIYSLARALDRLSRYDFPVQFNDANRSYFLKMADVVGGEEGAAMKSIVANPQDKAANDLLNKSPDYHAMLRTTCVATLMEAGHAANALPQRARATINCRAIPGTEMEDLRATLVKWVDDPEVTVTGQTGGGFPRVKPSAINEKVMGPIEKASGQVWPGVPVIPFMISGATDSTFMIAAGIPSYGVSGLFRGPDGGGMHGLNEHIQVKAVMEGREFLYRLVKLYADQKD
jgi:acetylornithine deacetylase/succinyl-diaminopimelate desuccinylase-like protein